MLKQTKKQQKQLKKNFGRNSLVMPSLSINFPDGRTANRHWFLWVGRADLWKRPEMFIRLAEKLPKEKFVMICRQGNDKQYFARIKTLAFAQTNLEFAEAVGHDAILPYFGKAKALVNTSIAEGWPNTFLQAGTAKTPIVSLRVNPENFITNSGCGFWAKNSFPELVKTCRRLASDKKLIRLFGSNNYLYVRKFHSLKNVRLLTRILLNDFTRPAA